MAEALRVNPIACDARGACAELLPEMITLDEWGYPILDHRPVPPALEKHARAAVSACPTLALRLTRELPPSRLTPQEECVYLLIVAFISWLLPKGSCSRESLLFASLVGAGRDLRERARRRP